MTTNGQGWAEGEESTSWFRVNDLWSALVATYAAMVREYTRKTLTYPTDILRAFSGALYQVYGAQTYYGLPWIEMDRALLWCPIDEGSMSFEHPETEVFPSWSWISSIGSKNPCGRQTPFQRPFGLAYWGRVIGTNDPIQRPPRVDVAVPVEETGPQRWDSTPWRKKNDYGHALPIVALASTEGCMPTGPSQDLLMDCSIEEYQRRLEDRWPDYVSYWKDVFATYQDNEVFTQPYINLAMAPGRLLVRAQKVKLNIHHGPKPRPVAYRNRMSVRKYIRTATGRLVGFLDHDLREPEDTLGRDLVEPAEFIAMSISHSWLGDPWYNHLGHGSETPSAPYGCPCDATYQASGMKDDCSYAAHAEHIEECPRHIDFFKTRHLSRDEASDYKLDRSSFFTGIKNTRHLDALSYSDAEGKLMHELDIPPTVNVMRIVPSKGRGKGTGVYQRVGLGRIYLKRWTEANPQFTTVVLE